MKRIDYYQLRFYYHNTTDKDLRYYYDSLLIYASYEDAVEQYESDWHYIEEPTDVLDFVTIRHLQIFSK